MSQPTRNIPDGLLYTETCDLNKNSEKQGSEM
jgi:hypothetical protein